MSHVTGSPGALEIFMNAVDIVEDIQRNAYLDRACGTQIDLRQRVDELLAAHQRGQPNLLHVALVTEQAGRLNAAGIDFGETDLSNPEAMGIAAADDEPIRGLIDVSKHPMIGHYKLLEEIGHGGMGTVYMAEQIQPVTRRVALKVIKPGMDTKEVIARFEAERQALALMDHANIARVFDGGTTSEGRPYFVMELVRGVSIINYCKQKKPPLRERLKLFIDICQAVQHAHQKGIIHRDLKPGNVLVSMHDHLPVVKVIDFGVAKALNQKLTQRTLFTQFSQMVGTPLYMAPEQAQMSGLDVDTRSDIYSLGVILYELLTGTTPFDKATLSSLGIDGIRKLIIEQEPQRPSARVSTLKAGNFPTVDDQRTLDTEDIAKRLKRELDWIVMKALEKDRERRYDSASAFAADVQRYLNDEPVLACPPTAMYRLKKYAKKHKAWLTTAALLILMLVNSTAVSWVFAYKANEAKEDAEEQRKEAVEARKLADKRLEQSRVDFDLALKSLDTIVEEVTSAEFAQMPGVDKVRSEILDKAMKFYGEIIEEHNSDPYARFHRALAYQKISKIHSRRNNVSAESEALHKCSSILEELLKEDPKNDVYRYQLIRICHQFAWQLSKPLEERIERLESALAQSKERPEQSDPPKWEIVVNTLSTMALLLPGNDPRADTAWKNAVSLAETHDVPPDPVYAAMMISHAERSGDLDRVAIWTKRRLELFTNLSETHPWYGNDQWWNKSSLVASWHNLANVYVRQGQLEEAERAFQKAYNDASSLFSQYSEVLGVRDAFQRLILDYYEFLHSTEREEEGIELFNKTLMQEPDFPDLHRTHSTALMSFDNSIERLTTAIDEFPNVAIYYHHRGSAFRKQREFEKALSDLEKALELDDSSSVQGLVMRAEVLNELNRRSEAVRIYNKAIQLQLEQTGNARHLRPGHGDFLYSNKDDRIEELSKAIEKYPTETGYYQYRGAAYRAQGEFENALADADRSIELANEGERYSALFARAHTHIAMGNDRSAIDDYNQILKVERPDWDEIHRRGACYFRIGEYDKALADLQEGMKRGPEDLWKLFDVPPSDVARCENEVYRQGYLELVDDVVEMNEESTAALVARASIKTAFEDFQQARQDLEIVLTRDDATYYQQYQVALLGLKLEETGDFRRLCKIMLEQLSESDIAIETHFTAWTCALAPNALDDYEPAITLARHAVEQDPGNQQYLDGLGAILMRAGKYGEAKDQLKKALEAGENAKTSPSYIHYFLAMTEHHLGNADAAKEHLATANESAEKELAGSPTWNRKLTLELLRKEAAALIKADQKKSNSNDNDQPENN